MAPFPGEPIRTPDALHLAFTLAAAVPAAEVEAAIRSSAPSILSSVRLFDVYHGEGVEPGQRSLAWRLVFRASDRTLTDQEVDDAVNAIRRRLEEDLDVRIRAS